MDVLLATFPTNYAVPLLAPFLFLGVTQISRLKRKRKVYNEYFHLTLVLYSISAVPCSDVKATGFLRQYGARTRSKSVLVRYEALLKQGAKAKL